MWVMGGWGWGGGNKMASWVGAVSYTHLLTCNGFYFERYSGGGVWRKGIGAGIQIIVSFMYNCVKKCV